MEALQHKNLNGAKSDSLPGREAALEVD